MSEPHWERGYRCHGFWVGNVRWGLVSIGPAGTTLASRDGYQWEFFPDGSTARKPHTTGYARTLREAKRMVEAVYSVWKKGVGGE